VVRHSSAKGIYGGSIPPQASMKEVVIFVVAFILPFLYYRTAFLIAHKKVFEQPLKTKSGFQIHHLHYGVVLVFLGTILSLFIVKNVEIIILQGLGLGLIFDELISSLLLPEDRLVGLEIYRKAFKSTFILFFLVSALLILSGWIFF
jgi:hypothetical protein